jgi:hypothetical protein
MIAIVNYLIEALDNVVVVNDIEERGDGCRNWRPMIPKEKDYAEAVEIDRERDREQAGLCADCQHSCKMTSDRGSVFWFCELSKVDARFVKYPRLPVRGCAGYEAKEDRVIGDRDIG